MILSTLAWYAFTALWAGAVAENAWRRRYALSYLSALAVLGCAYGLGFVPMLPAVAGLVGCGMSIAERRFEPTCLMLLSQTITDRDVLRNMRQGEIEVRASRRREQRCTICGAERGQPCDGGLHA